MRRLLFVHAHPDDESSKGAATAARYVDEGAEVVLVTCTDGAAGDVLNPHADPVQPGQMAIVRAGELERAIAAIGFTRAHPLGYVDSGYPDDPADVPDGTFAAIDLDEPARVLADLFRRERPHVVVTYPPDGGYPHPDHIRTHDVTMRALALAEDPDAAVGDDLPPPWRVAKVFAVHNMPTERLAALHGALVARGVDSEYVERLEQRVARNPHIVPDARIRVDDYFDQRDAALRAHVTQVDPDGQWFEIPRDLEAEHYPFEAYTLLRSDIVVDAPEEDLFAGLDVDVLDASAGVVARVHSRG